ncbi:MAG: hypothetical protein V4685_08035 [Bacteroidota bacterium]
MPKKKVPDIPEEYPKPKETPTEMPGKLPEIIPVSPETPLQVPPEAPEPVTPDEQPDLPAEVK